MNSFEITETENTFDKSNIEILEALDYSHIWTTDLSHIVEIYNRCKNYSGSSGLEIGTFRAHATLAMSLAGLSVRSYDTSDEHKHHCESQLLNRHVELIYADGVSEFLMPEKYHVIFHDSYHGNSVIPELDRFFKNKLLPGGILIVHDIDALDINVLLYVLGFPKYEITKDSRNRELGTFYFV
jgi:hypothetical protein